jgi:hypothetical protein
MALVYLQVGCEFSASSIFLLLLYVGYATDYPSPSVWVSYNPHTAHNHKSKIRKHFWPLTHANLAIHGLKVYAALHY